MKFTTCVQTLAVSLDTVRVGDKLFYVLKPVFFFLLFVFTSPPEEYDTLTFRGYFEV